VIGGARLIACSAAALLGAHVVAGQQPPAMYDEAGVPAYTLPDLLVTKDGERVRDPDGWVTRRRPEIVELYRAEVFGRAPAAPPRVEFRVDFDEPRAVDGRARRKQISFAPAGRGPAVRLLLHLPASASKPAPVFLGLSFTPNETVATAPQWQLERILSAGYGLATMHYEEIEPDRPDGLAAGFRPLFFKPGQTAPAPDEWGALAGWGWTLSRAMDYLATDAAVDAGRVALIGHSRLGKTALWSAALDERFSLVIANESGEGGAAISRRLYGERTKDLNTRFPHWFAGTFKKYDDRESEMPFDAHMLLALTAPRPLYVASAEEDRWADPRGEFLAAAHASAVWELFGKKGIGTTEMPAVHRPVGETVRYHVRAGKHDVTAYDWEQYLKFAGERWR
jgi:hypothetical protein